MIWGKVLLRLLGFNACADVTCSPSNDEMCAATIVILPKITRWALNNDLGGSTSPYTFSWESTISSLQSIKIHHKMDDLLISLCLENFFRTYRIFSYSSSQEHILTLITSLVAQLLIDLLLSCLLQEAALLISPLSNDLHGGTRSLWFLCRWMNVHINVTVI
jgi:hypothetical protein